MFRAFNNCVHPHNCPSKPDLEFIPQPLGSFCLVRWVCPLLPGRTLENWSRLVEGRGALSPPHPHSLHREGRTSFYSLLLFVSQAIHHPQLWQEWIWAVFLLDCWWICSPLIVFLWPGFVFCWNCYTCQRRMVLWIETCLTTRTDGILSKERTLAVQLLHEKGIHL